MNSYDYLSEGFASLLSLDPLSQELSRLLGASSSGTTPSSTQSFRVLMDSSENDTHYFYQFELPGVPLSDINVEVNDNTLTVSGERRCTSTGNSRFRERWFQYGRFNRSVRLPRTANADDVTARSENGVLTVSLAKLDAPRNSRKVNVQA